MSSPDFFESDRNISSNQIIEKGTDMLKPREMDPSVELVTKFVEVAKASVKPGIVCVDGGVTPDVNDTKGNKVDYRGMIGYPGGDAAMVSAEAAYNKANGVDFDAEELTRNVVTATKDVHGEFHLHTDTHAHHDHKVTGCGHEQGQCTHQFSEDYGVNPEQMTKANELLAKMGLEDEGVVNQNLDRNHEERGVLVNMGSDKTVSHWVTPEDFPGQSDEVYGQFFVLDDEASKNRFRAVWQKMGYDQDKISSMEQHLDKQAAVTYRRLAVGKPVYGFNADGDNVDVKFLGWIGQDGAPTETMPTT